MFELGYNEDPYLAPMGTPRNPDLIDVGLKEGAEKAPRRRMHQV